MQNLKLLSFILVLSIVGAQGCQFWAGDCPHAQWCEGDMVMECEDDGSWSGGSAVEDFSCREVLGTKCVERKTIHGNHIAGCLVKETKCAKGLYSMCLDDHQLAVCSSKKEAILLSPRSCLGDQTCVDSKVEKSAVCAWAPGLCDTEGAEQCVNGEYTTGYTTCTRDTWKKLEDCDACLEWTESGVPQAGCQMDDRPCQPGVKYMCDGDNILSCSETGYPILWKRCYLNEHCVITKTDQSQAICALSDDPCPPGKDYICVGNNIGKCANTGYPQYVTFDEGNCNGTICVETEDGPRCVEKEGDCKNGDRVCTSEQSIAVCDESLWLKSDWCPRDEHCVDTPDKQAFCVLDEEE